MKKLTLSLCAAVAMTTAAFAGTETYTKESKSVAPPPCPQWYADNEFNLTLSGLYAPTGNDWADDRYLVADHGWGGSIDPKYFIHKYFGFGVQGNLIHVNSHTFEDNGFTRSVIASEDRWVGSVSRHVHHAFPDFLLPLGALCLDRWRRNLRRRPGSRLSSSTPGAPFGIVDRPRLKDHSGRPGWRRLRSSFHPASRLDRTISAGMSFRARTTTSGWPAPVSTSRSKQRRIIQQNAGNTVCVPGVFFDVIESCPVLHGPRSKQVASKSRERVRADTTLVLRNTLRARNWGNVVCARSWTICRCKNPSFSTALRIWFRPSRTRNSRRWRRNRTRSRLQNFGRTMRLFAPLYLSNECINNCRYCGFSRDNPILRVTLSLEQVSRKAAPRAAKGFARSCWWRASIRSSSARTYLADCVRALAPDFSSISIEVGPMEAADYAPNRRRPAPKVWSFIRKRTTARSMPSCTPPGRNGISTGGWIARSAATRPGFRRLGIGALFGSARWQAGGARPGRACRVFAEALLAGANHRQPAAAASGGRRIPPGVFDDAIASWPN